MAYEFSHDENSIIETTAMRARAWGIVSLVIGVLSILAAVGAFTVSPAQGVIALLQVVVNIVVGVIFLNAGNSLKSVVDTQGNDIAHMMGAMQKLSLAFLVQLIAVGVGFVIGFAIGLTGVS